MTSYASLFLPLHPPPPHFSHGMWNYKQYQWKHCWENKIRHTKYNNSFYFIYFFAVALAPNPLVLSNWPLQLKRLLCGPNKCTKIYSLESHDISFQVYRQHHCWADNQCLRLAASTMRVNAESDSKALWWPVTTTVYLHSSPPICWPVGPTRALPNCVSVIPSVLTDPS
jgi:hypothetical protein